MDNPGVKFPPPFILIIAILIGFGLNFFLPFKILSDDLRFPLCFGSIIFGLSLILTCAFNFKKEKTNIEPWKTTHKLVTSGIYRFSRNPIYLGLTIIGVGVSFGINSLTVLLSIVPFIYLINKFVIKKEEVYLEGKFKDEYKNYKSKVRRWI